jgi:hypothetical protein
LFVWVAGVERVVKGEMVFMLLLGIVLAMVVLGAVLLAGVTRRI